MPMNPISFELGLLIIALVIASVSLFLSLFNAILLIDISKKISVLKKIGVSHSQNEVSTSYVQKNTALREQENTFTENTLQESFVSGMQSVIGRYTIDSMVVATTDGRLMVLLLLPWETKILNMMLPIIAAYLKGNLPNPNKGSCSFL